MRGVTAPVRVPLAVVLIAAHLTVLLAGCAAHVARPAAMTDERFAEVQTACTHSAALGVDAGGAATALGAGFVVGLAMAAQGAAEGARWGAFSGGGAGHGAWIGAAAGMGIGVIVGLAVGTKKGIDAYRGYRAGYEQCMLAELRPAETPHPDPPGTPPAETPGPEAPTP